MQAVRSVASDGKFYQLLPDKANTENESQVEQGKKELSTSEMSQVCRPGGEKGGGDCRLCFFHPPPLGRLFAGSDKKH